MANDNKILIIGLDGGTWKILRPMMAAGKMPNLKALSERGAAGTLTSTIPPVTAPAWTSFQTGVNPGKHGIFDFQSFDPETRQSSLVNSGSIPVKTVWDLVSSAGKKVITINVPLTYPPREDPNRITIGGMLSPREDAGLIYPNQLYHKFIRKVGYQITAGPLERRLSTKLERFIQQETDVEKKRFQVAKMLMDEFPWDLFMLHIQSSDGIQHCFYPHLDPECSDFHRDTFNAISGFYEAIDREIGMLLETVNDNVTVIVLSDHGFRPLRRYVNLNAWLRSQGMLSSSSLNIRGRCIELMRKYDVLRIRKRIAGRLLRNFLPLRSIATTVNNRALDWSRTRAFMPNGTVFGSIFVLDRENLQTLKHELVRELLQLVDPQTQRKVIRKTYARATCFSGPYVKLLPDLLIEPSEEYSFGIPLLADTKLFREAKYPYDFAGTHDLEGILVLAGNRIKAGARVRADITDICPTILAVMQIAVPRYIDGRVLQDVFTERVNVQIEKTDGLPASEHVDRTERADNEEVRKRLADLGYL
ncbi:MAG: alkaline phosphatase family protein [Planctomycetota bacterium]|jgi:predicted AlkP superfamily phosphohydrolase/phosphomutase